MNRARFLVYSLAMLHPISARVEAAILVKYALLNTRALILDPWVIDNIAKLCEIDGVIDDVDWIWIKSITDIMCARSYDIEQRRRRINAILAINGTDPVESSVVRIVSSLYAFHTIIRAAMRIPDEDYIWLVRRLSSVMILRARMLM